MGISNETTEGENIRAFERVEVLENATVIYTDGVTEQFEAVRLTDGGVIIGRIMNEGGHEEFVACGFIPRRNIKKINEGAKRKMAVRPLH
jgi:hypothetical protein